jgi:fatty-acyl-CoA synthase
MELSNRTLGGWLEHWAAVTPDREYLVYSDRDLRFSWKTFNRRVDDMAKGLLSIGVKRGTHIGIWATNVPDWLTFLFAGAKIGAVLVTVNTNYQQNELEFLVKDSDIQTLCITDGIFDGSYVDMVYTMLPELRESQRGYLHSKRFPRLRNIVYIGQEKYRGMYNTAEILLLGSNIDDDVLREAKEQVNCFDVVNMQYTSGTTGFPKGVMLTHHNIANNGYFTGEGMGFTSEDKLCCCVPLFHCFGVVLASMNVLTHGCTQVMVEKFDPLVVLASIHKERCTALYGVPTMFIAEMNHPMFDLFDLTSLRTGIRAGSLCPLEVMRAVTGKMHLTYKTSVYGLTESSPGMTHSVLEDSFEDRCTTVGREYPFTEVSVIDPETGKECPAGVQGEMCCRGYLVRKGYYNNPEATAEVIDPDGWLHSGDLGIRDENGYYRITGRIKDMIIRGGENIYPREIEEFLYHLEGIRDVQVAAVPSPKYGEEVGAFIIQKEGVSLTEEIVKDFCRGKIARHKIPKYVFFIDEFPMTGSGKIQKFKLKDLSLRLLAEQGIEPA